VKRLRERLQADIRAITASQDDAQTGATHEEARQEDPKDTRAIEAAYLARGLAERAELMHDALARLTRLEIVDFGADDPVGVTALVGLEDDDGESVYFVIPHAAGETVVIDDTTIRIVTPTSPLGQAIIGQYVDDVVDLDLPGGRRTATIAWVR
jgi:transcription elongation GreA/GreB family factor